MSFLGSKLSNGLLSHPDERPTAQLLTRPNRAHPHGSLPSFHASHTWLLICKHAGTPACLRAFALAVLAELLQIRASQQAFPFKLLLAIPELPKPGLALSLIVLPSHKLSFLLVYSLPPQLEGNIEWCFFNAVPVSSIASGTQVINTYLLNNKKLT